MDLKYCEHVSDGKICPNLRNDPTQKQFYATCALNGFVSVGLVSCNNCIPTKSSIPKIKGDMSRFYLKPNKFED